MASRRIQCARACLVAVALGSVPLSAQQLPQELAPVAGAADRAAVYVASRTQYTPGGRPPTELIVISKDVTASHAPEIADEARRTLALLDEWLGPLGRDRLTIVDVPWNSDLVFALVPGVVVVRSRWLSQQRDRALDRESIAGLSRQYWLRDASHADRFTEALSVFVAGRAIDIMLQGRQFHADRYLGGFLPFAIRSLSLSPIARDARPRLRRYPEIERAQPQALRAGRVIEVAERYLGWPALQQAISTLRGRGSVPSAAALAAVVSEQQGHDLSWLFDAALPEDATFDYAISRIDNRATANGEVDVRVSIERRGSAVFARPLPIEMRFADGSSFRDRWDPRRPQEVLEYVSTSPAVSAAIDPDVILILDEQRSNNVASLQPAPWSRLALKLACDWTIWLQNAMLAYSGLV